MEQVLAIGRSFETFENGDLEFAPDDDKVFRIREMGAPISFKNGDERRPGPFYNYARLRTWPYFAMRVIKAYEDHRQQHGQQIDSRGSNKRLETSELCLASDGLG